MGHLRTRGGTRRDRSARAGITGRREFLVFFALFRMPPLLFFVFYRPVL